jgi:hypothetical protein
MRWRALVGVDSRNTTLEAETMALGCGSVAAATEAVEGTTMHPTRDLRLAMSAPWSSRPVPGRSGRPVLASDAVSGDFVVQRARRQEGRGR